MKIKDLHIGNHNVLGNLALDFSDEEGNVFDTVILAGENGTCKTRILEQLYFLSICDTHGLGISEERKAGISLTEIELVLIEETRKNRGHQFSLKGDIEIYQRGIDASSYAAEIGSNGNRGAFNWQKLTKALFLDARINFKETPITSITALDVDSEFKSELTIDTSFDEIAQLLVNIDMQDKSDFGEYFKKHGKLPPEDEQFVRMKRFTQAFSYFFPTKKFKGVEQNTSGQKFDILFLENGKEVPLDDLSSGEKQIIYRAGKVLKNLGTLEGVIIFIDEPEISLHPDWQQKIVGFYENLVTNNYGEQTSQIFIATHSPFIIHDSNSRLIIGLEKDESNLQIKMMDPTVYPFSSESKTVEKAFNIKSLPSSVEGQITIFTEDENIKFLKLILESSGFDLEKTIIHSYPGKSSFEGAIKYCQIENSKNPSLKILIHKDRDYMSDKAVQKDCQKVESAGGVPFFPIGTDIESHFLDVKYLHEILPDISEAKIKGVIGQATEESMEEALEGLTIVYSSLKTARIIYSKNPIRFRHGKSVLKKVEEIFKTQFDLDVTHQPSKFLGYKPLIDFLKK